MSKFEEIMLAILTAGKILGPVFIHSTHGVAILNASEETLGAVLQAHQQATAVPPTVAAPPTEGGVTGA